MKNADQQIQENLQKAVRIASGFSKRTVFVIRIVVLSLLLLWILGALYLHHQVKQDEQRLEQSRIEAARRREFQRRGAQYRQQLDEFNQGVRSRNAFDGR